MKTLRGQNLVELQGEVTRPNYGHTNNGFPFFKIKMGIPIVHKFPNHESITKNNYVRCIAWGDLAESLKEEVRHGSWIKVIGHIQEKSFIGNCKSCGSKSKIYYTEVLITNFQVVEV